MITNAVLEGGEPFPLTVRSSSGSLDADAAYRFDGDYLRAVYPSGTQYLFGWRFSGGANGTLVWNGSTFWAGGHLWQVAISNITCVPLPWLDISRVGTTSVQIAWPTSFSDHVLECAAQLPAQSWSTVTNAPTPVGGRLTVTLGIEGSERFYRLRKL